MTRQQIELGVLEVLSTVLKREFHTTDGLERTSTEGWDSLKHIEIVFAIEDRFGVQFTDDEMPMLDAARRFVELLESRHAA